VLYNFIKTMNTRGQLIETMEALRKVAPDSAADVSSLSFHIGKEANDKLLYQGYIVLKAHEFVALDAGNCDFRSGTGIPSGTRVRLAYPEAVSCKNDPTGGQLALVEYQDRIWSAHVSGFTFVIAPADSPIRPFENRTYEQAIAQLTGGSNAPVDEVALGLMARKDILGKQKIYIDEAAQRAGTHAFQILMSTPLARSGNVPAFDLTLLDDNTVNAFSTAGGHIYVDKGMLPVVGDDTGMWSAVIAHEVAHVVAHHQYKAYTRATTLKATQEALRQQAALGNKSAQWAYLFSLGGGHLLNMKLSRNEELEADRLGLMMMAQAGIHPDYAEVLMRRLHAITGDKNKMAAFLLSDHPRWETREKQVRKAHEEALSIFNRQFANAADSPGGVPPAQ
jgi:Peptidase family M48